MMTIHQGPETLAGWSKKSQKAKMDSLKEVVSFLPHERIEVRQMAVESLAGISLDENVKTEFASHPEFLEALVMRLDDQPAVALHAWKVLINLSKDQRISSNLYSHTSKVIKVITDETTLFADFACMLLANISQNEYCHLTICDHLPTLLTVYLKGRSFNPKGSLDFLASVFAHVSNCKEGREFFLRNKFENFYKILSQSQSSQIIRRGGTISTIKNCLFDTEMHQSLLECDDEEDRLLANLLGHLASPQSVFDEEDLEEMILDVQLEYRHTPAEEDPTIRNLILDCFVLLGTSRLGRDKLRAKKIYSILREWHKQEPEEILQELTEKVVELLIRDEEEAPRDE